MIHKKAVGRIWALVFVTTAILSSFLLFTRNENAAQETPVLKVGDHVEYVDVYKGTVTEIGAGTDKGCYRIRSDNAGHPSYKGDLACTFGRIGVLFLIDKNGKRLRDVNAPRAVHSVAADKEGETANAAKGDFADGDRVEGRSGSVWYKCTVVGARRQTGGYVLRCDNRPLEEAVFAASDVRQMQSPDPDGKRIAADAKNTVAQADAQCSGQPLLNFHSRGRTASPDLFGQVIKSTFDDEGRGDKHLHKVVTQISRIEVGAAFRFQATATTMGIPTGTKAYPVKTDFVTCNDGPFDWSIAEYQNYEYVCYVDETRNGEWSCGVNVSGKITSRLIPKQAQNDLFVGRPPGQ
jgi:hypothetical protein